MNSFADFARRVPPISGLRAETFDLTDVCGSAIDLNWKRKNTGRLETKHEYFSSDDVKKSIQVVFHSGVAKITGRLHISILFVPISRLQCFALLANPKRDPFGPETLSPQKSSLFCMISPAPMFLRFP